MAKRCKRHDFIFMIQLANHKARATIRLGKIKRLEQHRYFLQFCTKRAQMRRQHDFSTAFMKQSAPKRLSRAKALNDYLVRLRAGKQKKSLL